MGSIVEPCYIQNSVITNRVIKRLMCILHMRECNATSVLLISETVDTNATYGLYMEVAKSGVMKKSDMAVNLLGSESKQKLLNVSM